ncbi:acyl-CoA carboxylase epsilon subunit [Streptomyces sp. NPDC024089]|uniref:acyl-CoA carboxylase epsilon subunit n=1 Tax=Streptomyces sp. NPDC024089 TaxID=3154328 RepID=UPI0033E91D1F
MTAGETGSGPATALALASVRITRGNPSLDEVAALATVLAARAQAHAQSTGHRTDRPGPNSAEAAARTRWQHLAGPFRAPGAWAS